MPKTKLKTHRGAAKRFKRTATGKFIHKRTGASHLLTGKPAKRMRHLTQPAVTSASETKTLRRLLPYG